MGEADLDIRFERASGSYRTVVVASPAGEGMTSAFDVPITPLDLEWLSLHVPDAGYRGAAAGEARAMDFGGRLFDAVFHGDLLTCLRQSLALTNAGERVLRVRMRHAETPELALLPWELLFDRRSNRFLCLSDRTPITRFLEVSEPLRMAPIDGPLRLLVMISSPKDLAPLDVEAEWRRLHDALAELEAAGLVVVDRLRHASRSALRRQLRRSPYHVFHFIGHGGFDETNGEGVLALTDSDGSSRPIRSGELGVDLHDATTLRLAVLNACKGAKGDSRDPYAGVAQSLIQQGLPAVIAMQFEVSDEAAIAFAHEFYAAVADGLRIDTAIGQARKAIHDISRLEWATPVLYQRSAVSELFDRHDADGGPEPGLTLVGSVQAETVGAGGSQTGALAEGPLPAGTSIAGTAATQHLKGDQTGVAYRAKASGPSSDALGREVGPDSGDKT
jgi:hypothetical protein